jgi:hypothetical protein
VGADEKFDKFKGQLIVETPVKPTAFLNQSVKLKGIGIPVTPNWIYGQSMG